LTVQQIPLHTHGLQATDANVVQSPLGATLAVPSSSAVSGLMTYGPTPANTPLASSIQNTGGGQPHNNLQPFLCLNFIISLFGLFPTQT
jgi:microcystin-dependent protein